MTRTKIITKNKEIYDKFTMLNFSNEIVLQNTKPVYIKRILKNINKKNKILEFQNFDKYCVVTKIKPINFDIYLRNI